MPKIVETRQIDLPKGGTLEVQMTREFINKTKKHFGLKKKDELTDDHIRMFVYGSLSSAVEGATEQVKQQPVSGSTQ